MTRSIWIHAGILAWNEDSQQWEIIQIPASGTAGDAHRFLRRSPRTRAIGTISAPTPTDAGRSSTAGCVWRRPTNFGSPLRLAEPGPRRADTPAAVAALVPTRDLGNGDDEGRLPYCSELVSLATRIGGGVDLVPHLPDCFTEPHHMAQSLFYGYAGTFWPAEAAP